MHLLLELTSVSTWSPPLGVVACRSLVAPIPGYLVVGILIGRMPWPS